VTPPYRPGQFVWCRFPTAEEPEAPGPKSRIGYVLAVRRIGRDDVAAFLYTTTVRWPTEDAQPLGVIPINKPQARAAAERTLMMNDFWPIVAADIRGGANPDRFLIRPQLRAAADRMGNGCVCGFVVAR